MRLEVLASGAVNNKPAAVASLRLGTEWFHVYASGSRVLVLGADMSRMHDIDLPGPVHAIDACVVDFKIAVAVGNGAHILKPTGVCVSDARHNNSGFTWTTLDTLNCAEPVYSVSWDSSGVRLLTGGESIVLWCDQARSEEEVIGMQEEDEMVYSTSSRFVPLWRLAMASPVQQLRFSPDGRHFASYGAADRLLKLWTRNDSLLFVRPEHYDFTYLPHPRAVRSIEWRQPLKSNDPNVLLTACADNVARFWIENCADDSFSVAGSIDSSTLGAASPNATNVNGTSATSSEFSPQWLFVRDLFKELSGDEPHNPDSAMSSPEGGPVPIGSGGPRGLSAGPSGTLMATVSTPTNTTSNNNNNVNSGSLRRSASVDVLNSTTQQPSRAIPSFHSTRPTPAPTPAPTTPSLSPASQRKRLAESSSLPRENWPDIVMYVTSAGSLCLWRLLSFDDPTPSSFRAPKPQVIESLFPPGLHLKSMLVYPDVTQSALRSGQLPLSLVMRLRDGALTKFRVVFAERTQFSKVISVEHVGGCRGHTLPITGLVCHPHHPIILSVALSQTTAAAAASENSGGGSGGGGGGGGGSTVSTSTSTQDRAENLFGNYTEPSTPPQTTTKSTTSTVDVRNTPLLSHNTQHSMHPTTSFSSSFSSSSSSELLFWSTLPPTAFSSNIAHGRIIEQYRIDIPARASAWCWLPSPTCLVALVCLHQSNTSTSTTSTQQQPSNAGGRTVALLCPNMPTTHTRVQFHSIGELALFGRDIAAFPGSDESTFRVVVLEEYAVTIAHVKLSGVGGAGSGCGGGVGGVGGVGVGLAARLGVGHQQRVGGGGASSASASAFGTEITLLSTQVISLCTPALRLLPLTLTPYALAADTDAIVGIHHTDHSISTWLVDPSPSKPMHPLSSSHAISRRPAPITAAACFQGRIALALNDALNSGGSGGGGSGNGGGGNGGLFSSAFSFSLAPSSITNTSTTNNNTDAGPSGPVVEVWEASSTGSGEYRLEDSIAIKGPCQALTWLPHSMGGSLLCVSQPLAIYVHAQYSAASHGRWMLLHRVALDATAIGPATMLSPAGPGLLLAASPNELALFSKWVAPGDWASAARQSTVFTANSRRLATRASEGSLNVLDPDRPPGSGGGVSTLVQNVPTLVISSPTATTGRTSPTVQSPSGESGSGSGSGVRPSTLPTTTNTTTTIASDNQLVSMPSFSLTHFNTIISDYSVVNGTLLQCHPRHLLHLLMRGNRARTRVLLNHLCVALGSNDLPLMPGTQRHVVPPLPIADLIRLEALCSAALQHTATSGGGMGGGMGGMGGGGGGLFDHPASSSSSSLFQTTNKDSDNNTDTTTGGEEGSDGDTNTATNNTATNNTMSKAMTEKLVRKFDKTTSTTLCDLLSFRAVHRLSAVEQMSLAAIVEAFSAIDGEMHSSALDECGVRFYFAARRHSALSRTASTLARTGLRTSEYVWAYFSDAHERLLELCLSNRATYDWTDLRALGAAYWVRSPDTLKACCEKIAKHRFAQARQPLSAALFYLALRKKNVLWGLFRSVQDEKMSGFMCNDFTQERWQSAAMKNAFALLSKQRYEEAAAFFLLSGRLSDAVQVCVANIEDIHLAVFIARLYEGDGGPVLQDLLTTRILPTAEAQHDLYMTCIARWMLRDPLGATEGLLSPNVHGDKSRADTDAPALLSLYQFLRKHPQVSMSGALPIPPAMFRRTAYVFAQTGLPALALETLHDMQVMEIETNSNSNSNSSGGSSGGGDGSSSGSLISAAAKAAQTNALIASGTFSFDAFDFGFGGSSSSNSSSATTTTTNNNNNSSSNNNNGSSSLINRSSSTLLSTPTPLSSFDRRAVWVGLQIDCSTLAAQIAMQGILALSPSVTEADMHYFETDFNNMVSSSSSSSSGSSGSNNNTTHANTSRANETLPISSFSIRSTPTTATNNTTNTTNTTTNNTNNNNSSSSLMTAHRVVTPDLSRHLLPTAMLYERFAVAASALLMVPSPPTRNEGFNRLMTLLTAEVFAGLAATSAEHSSTTRSFPYPLFRGGVLGHISGYLQELSSIFSQAVAARVELEPLVLAQVLLAFYLTHVEVALAGDRVDELLKTFSSFNDLGTLQNMGIFGTSCDSFADASRLIARGAVAATPTLVQYFAKGIDESPYEAVDLLGSLDAVETGPTEIDGRPVPESLFVWTLLRLACTQQAELTLRHTLLVASADLQALPTSIPTLHSLRVMLIARTVALTTKLAGLPVPTSLSSPKVVPHPAQQIFKVRTLRDISTNPFAAIGPRRLWHWLVQREGLHDVFERHVYPPSARTVLIIPEVFAWTDTLRVHNDIAAICLSSRSSGRMALASSKGLLECSLLTGKDGIDGGGGNGGGGFESVSISSNNNNSNSNSNSNNNTSTLTTPTPTNNNFNNLASAPSRDFIPTGNLARALSVDEAAAFGNSGNGRASPVMQSSNNNNSGSNNNGGSGSNNNTLRIQNLHTHLSRRSMRPVDADPDSECVLSKTRPVTNVRALAAHQSSPLYVAGGADGSVRLYQFDGPQLWDARASGPRVTHVAFDASGDKFGVTDISGELWLWRLARFDAAPYLQLSCHNRRADAFTFLTTPSVVATGGLSSDGLNCSIWDTLLPQRQALVRSFNVCDGGVRTMLHLPHLQRIVCGGRMGDVAVVDLRQMSVVASWSTQGGMVRALTTYGDMVISGCADGSVKLWSLKGNNVRTWTNVHTRPTVLTRSAISGLVVSGSQLFSTGSDGLVKCCYLE